MVQNRGISFKLCDVCSIYPDSVSEDCLGVYPTWMEAGEAG